MIHSVQSPITHRHYLSVVLQPFVGPWPLLSFLIFYTVGRAPWTGDQSVVRSLPIDRTTQTQNKRTQTAMPRVEFEPTIPVFGAGEDSSCLKPRGPCDRHICTIKKN
jgi:hypothetical protein